MVSVHQILRTLVEKPVIITPTLRYLHTTYRLVRRIFDLRRLEYL